jgi:hypothetical protein
MTKKEKAGEEVPKRRIWYTFYIAEGERLSGNMNNNCFA